MNEGVYAAGDVAAPLPGASWGLWHSAEAAGATAGTNMAGGSLRPEPKPHRLKCEAFGGYLFSLNYWNAHSDELTKARTICNSQALYVRVWELAGRSIAVVLDAYPNPGRAWAKGTGKRLEELVSTGARADDIREALEAQE